MRIYLFILIGLLSSNAQATPKKIEMIFLSAHKVSQLMKTIQEQSGYKKYSLLSQTADDNCVPMGEGCFHPQLGYIEKKPEAGKASSIRPVVVKDEDLKLKTFNAIETSMINCDKGNYFDIYCGQEKSKAANSEIEIWFDVSSSLRAVDYNKDENFCNRRSFMTKVMEGCKDKVQVSVYNTSLKAVGDFSSICTNYGTNDENKLLQWMKDSQAKLLLIVTDIDEMSRAMRDFLESRGAKFIGDGVKPFTSEDLLNYAKDFTKECSAN
jgi:hypothetical protein